jgi:hypothetical protein
MVNKKEVLRMLISLFVLSLEYGWYTLELRGQEPLIVQRGGRYLNATSFGAICILGWTSCGLSWVACGTVNCGQRAWYTLLRTCQVYKGYIYFHFNTKTFLGLIYKCFIQRFSSCISMFVAFLKWPHIYQSRHRIIWPT